MWHHPNVWSIFQDADDWSDNECSIPRVAPAAPPLGHSPHRQEDGGYLCPKVSSNKPKYLELLSNDEADMRRARDSGDSSQNKRPLAASAPALNSVRKSPARSLHYADLSTVQPRGSTVSTDSPPHSPPPSPRSHGHTGYNKVTGSDNKRKQNSSEDYLKAKPRATNNRKLPHSTVANGAKSKSTSKPVVNGGQNHPPMAAEQSSQQGKTRSDSTGNSSSSGPSESVPLVGVSPSSDSSGPANAFSQVSSLGTLSETNCWMHLRPPTAE